MNGKLEAMRERERERERDYRCLRVEGWCCIIFIDRLRFLSTHVLKNKQIIFSNGHCS